MIKNNYEKDDIYVGINGKRREYYLKYYIDNKIKIYFYDFTLLSKKLMIEFNGTYYHAKNTLTEIEKINWTKNRGRGISADYSIKHDEHKMLIAKLNGFKLLTIWDDVPFYENIKIINQFLNNNGVNLDYENFIKTFSKN